MINNTSPTLFIGNTPIHGRLILAPMDGYTDTAFRIICRSFGSAICVSEFINGLDVAHGHPHLETKLTYAEMERPFAYQIFDDNPERILNAARKLRLRNPDFIDINMGCSARNVSNRGAGAGLLKHPTKVAQIMESLVKEIDLPITAKIRLGWDDKSLNYMEIAHILQESGASLVAVHARTRKQEYSGSAYWPAIAEVKNSLNIPVIGNGDVKNQQDAERMMSETGCDAVMIGRAAIGNPWIFANLNRDQVPLTDRFSVIKTHIENIIMQYGPKIGIILFRKHLTRYLEGYLTTSEIRRKIYAIEEQFELINQIEELLFTNQNYEQGDH